MPDADWSAAYLVARRSAPGFRPGDWKANNHQRIPGAVLADLRAGRAVSSVCSSCSGTYLAGSVRQRRCEVCQRYGKAEAVAALERGSRDVGGCTTNQDDQGSDLGLDKPRKGAREGSASCPTGEAVSATDPALRPELTCTPRTIRVGCQRCSRPFDRPVRRGRPQVYCGPECARVAANRQRQGRAIR